MKNKIIKIALATIFVLVLLYCVRYVIMTNSSENVQYLTEQPIMTSIKQSAIATGKINPKEKVDIKPNISGIISKIYLKEGDNVRVGELIATIKVVPVVANINTALQAINSAKIQLDNQIRTYNRQKSLYTQGVISKQEFENIETEYKLAKQTLNKAQQDYEIAKTGVAPGLEDLASIQIKSTANGKILDIPVEVGDQVIEANTFNAGTTIASVADVSRMIFEGKVDEADAGKMKEGMSMNIVIGALQDQDVKGELTFIAPQGKEENGAVKYDIKADIIIPSDIEIRAGYSANAEVTLNQRKNVLAIREALLQYEDNDKPFIEIQNTDGKFRKVYVELGLSDGLNIEIKKGLNKNDKIKVWNASEEEKNKQQK